MSDPFALLFSLKYKFLNNPKSNTADTLNVPVHILHSAHCKTSPCLGVRFTFCHNFYRKHHGSCCKLGHLQSIMIVNCFFRLS